MARHSTLINTTFVIAITLLMVSVAYASFVQFETPFVEGGIQLHRGRYIKNIGNSMKNQWNNLPSGELSAAIKEGAKKLKENSKKSAKSLRKRLSKIKQSVKERGRKLRQKLKGFRESMRQRVHNYTRPQGSRG